MPDRLSFRRPPRLLTAAVTAFMAAGIAGCAEQEDTIDKNVHCIDENGEVVDPDQCDEDNEYSGWPPRSGPSYWLYVAARRYAVGSRVPDDHKTRRIVPWDKDARANAGLPSTGKVAGTTIRGSGFGYRGGGSGSRSGGGYWGGGS